MEKRCDYCGVLFHRPPRYSNAQWEARRFCNLRCHGLMYPAQPQAIIPFQNRFWAMVLKGAANECWPWQGGTDEYGYGLFRVDADHIERANRVALRLDGRLPDDALKALHTCDNPPCCNPAHLFPGTPLDNARDRDAKGRGVVPNRRKNHAPIL